MRFKKYLVLFILILGFIPLLDLLHPGLPITHDGQDHVARIANFYQSLSEGNIIPRWASNLNWGYGHPILMFLYPLPSYIASFFHFLGFSLIDSLKIVFGLAFILSGVTMFLWVRTFLTTEAAIISSMLYMYAPYHFIDLYVRGALGEHIAFVFPPLVLFFFSKLSKKYKPIYLLGGSLSLAGLILSHNAISLMFLPVIFLYIIFLYYQNKSKKFIYNTLIIGALGFGISSFFWLPAFVEGKYTLRDIVTAGDYKTRFVSLADFIYGNWNYGISGQFSVQVGVINWLFTLISLPVTYILYKKKNNLWLLSFGTLIVLLFSFFIMLPQSKFIWEKFLILQNFQFPWRFLSVVVFATSLLGGIAVSRFSKRSGFFIVVAVLIGIVLFENGYWKAKQYKIFPESFFTGTYNSTTDTGESAPIWSVRFMEHRPKAHLEVIQGNAIISEKERTTTKHDYDLRVQKLTRFRENTLYFPGWEVMLDGRKIPIEFQDPSNRGLMTFYVPAGNHSLSINFGETKFREFADLVSIASIISLFILWKNKRFQ